MMSRKDQQASCLIQITLYLPPFPKESPFREEDSWLFNCALKYQDDILYCFGAPGIKKDPSLGEIFKSLKPNDDESYTIELGVILPDLLPNINENGGYTVEIQQSEERNLFCISNNMIKISYSKKRENSFFNIDDIIDFPEFISSLKDKNLSVIMKIWNLLPQKIREVISQWSHDIDIDYNYQNLIISGLNEVIKSRSFYEKEIFDKYLVDGEEICLLINQGIENLGNKDLQRLNRLLFETIYKRLLKKCENYYYVIVDRRAADQPEVLEKLCIPRERSIEFLRTMVTSRYQVRGFTAEEALTNNIEDCIEKFVRGLNVLLKAYILAEGKINQYGIFSNIYHINNFDFVYVMMKGRNPDSIEHLRLSPHILRSGYNPLRLNIEQTQTFRGILDGTHQMTLILELIYDSKQLIKTGNFVFALLQLMIACETAITQYVEKKYREAGISNNNIKQLFQELKFSINLNLNFPMLFPQNNRLTKNCIDIINKGRRLRNSIMHEGDSKDVTQEFVIKLYNAAIEIIDSIERVKESEKNDSSDTKRSIDML